MNEAETKEYKREWYQKNKERVDANFKKRLDDTEEREKIRKWQKKAQAKYYANNREEKAAYQRNYLKTTQGKAYRQKWIDDNKEKTNARLNERLEDPIEKEKIRRVRLKAGRKYYAAHKVNIDNYKSLYSEIWNEGHLTRENRYERWTVGEDLLALADNGLSLKEKGLILGRSTNAVSHRLSKLRKGMTVKETPSILIGQTERIV